MIHHGSTVCPFGWPRAMMEVIQLNGLQVLKRCCVLPSYRKQIRRGHAYCRGRVSTRSKGSSCVRMCLRRAISNLEPLHEGFARIGLDYPLSVLRRHCIGLPASLVEAEVCSRSLRIEENSYAEAQPGAA